MAKKEKQAPQSQENGAAPVAVKSALQTQVLVAGPKAPRHRAGHNGAAWTAITAKLPATAADLAALPEVQACGGTKANGNLFLGYALRRGWLAIQQS
jgi:hypothetical protein